MDGESTLILHPHKCQFQFDTSSAEAAPHIILALKGERALVIYSYTIQVPLL